MTAPFAVLCTQRMNDVQKCAGESLDRLNKWRMLSGNKMVSLDEVAWLGALLIKAGLTPQAQTQVEKSEEGNVVTVTAGSGLNAKDSTKTGG